MVTVIVITESVIQGAERFCLGMLAPWLLWSMWKKRRRKRLRSNMSPEEEVARGIRHDWISLKVYKQ